MMTNNRNLAKPSPKEVTRAYLMAQGVSPQQIGMSEEEAREYGMFGDGQVIYEEENQTKKNVESALQDMINRMDKDLELSLLKQMGINLDSIEDLGVMYIVLRNLGIQPAVAYTFTQIDRKRDMEKIQPPPVIGRVNSKTAVDKDYYTPEEVDRLTETDLKDPKVLQTVMNSMTKWRK